jgi:hypothetical protein
LAPAGGKIALAKSEPAPTLDALFEQIGTDTIHWMRLDIRHFDALPFPDWTASQPHPWVLQVNLSENVADGGAPQWEAGLFEKGYRLAGVADGSRFYLLANCPLAEHLQNAPDAPLRKHRDETTATQVAETPLQYLYVRMQKAEQRAWDAAHRLAEAEAKLAQTEARIAQAELETLAALAEARQIAVLQRQLSDVYASTSWQVTKPMRWLSRLRRSPRAALPELGNVLRSTMRRLSGAVARRLIRFVVARPWLKRIALHFPSVVQRVKGHVRQDLDAMSPTPPASQAPAPSSRTTVLGPRFRALILDEIQRYEDPQYQGNP